MALRYNIRRDVTLTWEYQFSSIVSNTPEISSTRSFVAFGATYRY
jgi:hypothetical protein